jgi:hypothetical protein
MPNLTTTPTDSVPNANLVDNSSVVLTDGFLVQTSVALVAFPNPSTPGSPVTFTATVSSSSGTPTGTLYFTDYGRQMSVVTLSGGVGSFTTSALSTGTHQIAAYYIGDGGVTYDASNSATLTQMVGGGGPVTGGLSFKGRSRIN